MDKILRKWNYDLHDYEDVKVKDLKYKIYSEDMDEIINCIQCGKEMRFGVGYTSLEFHNDFGFGYSVCEECYEKEWQRKRENE